MTPREIQASIHFLQRQLAHEAAERLEINAQAARGKPEAIKRQARELRKD